MFDDARAYFLQNVVPSYKEFFAHRDTNEWGENQLLRRALSAAGALFNMREQLPTQVRPSRTDLEKLCPDYGLVADVSNAGKHGVLTKGKPRISRPEQVREHLVSTLYRDEKGEYSGVQLDILVTLDDGSCRILADILHGVMDMWCAQLDAMGIIKMGNPIPPVREMPRTRADCEARQAPITVIQAENRNLRVALRRWNYVKGCSERVDLTGSKLEMRVYEQPASIVTTTITSPQLGVSVSFEVPLTKEQAAEYVKLPAKRGERFLISIVFASAFLRARLQDSFQRAVDAKK